MASRDDIPTSQKMTPYSTKYLQSTWTRADKMFKGVSKIFLLRIDLESWMSNK